MRRQGVFILVKIMLKEYLSEDMLHMLDLGEFAKYMNFNDLIIRAVVEENTAQKSGNRNLNFTGLYGDFIELYFRVEDYISKKERLPVHGEVCYLNGKRYEVVKCIDEQGMAHLVLSGYRQNTLKQSEMKSIL